MKRKVGKTQDRFCSGKRTLDSKQTRLRAKFVHQKKRDEISNLDLLPEDLKLAILTRSRAKSLMNLRCVSKMWSSIIRSPEFVRSFFSISSSRPRFILALSNTGNLMTEYLTFFFSFSTDDQEESSSLVPNFEMAIPRGVFFRPDLTRCCTSVHGFLTLQLNCQLALCNPCTEQLLYFPGGTRYVGYDPINDQFKALIVPSYIWGHLDHKVLTLGGGGGWRHIKPPLTTPYTALTDGVSINGFVYYAAYSDPYKRMNPGIVCFDVRSEKLTYIKAPPSAVLYGRNSTLIEYQGKLASVVFNPNGPRFQRFDLWVLEDVRKHKWSQHICVFPLSLWDFVCGSSLSCPGTNKAGEIIMAPSVLPRHVQPFYIFYYNVETKNIRKVRLLGIGDNQEFRRSYGFTRDGECQVRIAPRHIESIAFFKNPTTS